MTRKGLPKSAWRYVPVACAQYLVDVHVINCYFVSHEPPDIISGYVFLRRCAFIAIATMTIWRKRPFPSTAQSTTAVHWRVQAIM